MPAAQDRDTVFVQYGAARLFVRRQGDGPLVVLLPSQARDSDDYDEVAAGLAAGGYRVLRPQPRGIGASTGPLSGLTLRDLAQDIAEVVQHQQAGPAVVFGHAFGHYVARMVAHAFPDNVRGIVVAAAAARTYPPELSLAVTQAGDVSLPDEMRLAALRRAFFAPGNDPRCWLRGWHPHMQAPQRAARRAVDQDEYWGGGDVPLLDLQAEFDPFMPPERRMDMRNDFGERVSISLVGNASHALIPEQPTQVVDATLAWMRNIGHNSRRTL
jgi:pimeloyl-ACP methyl ester carboxylesterase